MAYQSISAYHPLILEMWNYSKIGVLIISSSFLFVCLFSYLVLTLMNGSGMTIVQVNTFLVVLVVRVSMT